MTDKKKLNYGTLLTIAVAFGVIIYFALTDPNVRNLGALLSKFKVQYILGMLACTAIFIVSDSGVLYVGCRLVPGEMTFMQAVKATLIGAYYSALTPFSSGGQPMQVAYMRRWKVPTASSSSILVLSFYFWHICISTLSILAFVFYKDMIAGNAGVLTACIVGIILSLIGVVTGTLILFGVDFRPIVFVFLKLLKKLGILKNSEKADNAVNAVNRWVDDFKKAFGILKKYPKDMLIMLFFAAIKVIGYSSVTYLLYRGFGLSTLSFVKILLLQILLATAVAFVPIPGASGASEGAFYIFFNSIFTNGTTFPAMLIWRGFTYYIFLLIGALIYIVDGISEFKNRLKKKSVPEI